MKNTGLEGKETELFSVLEGYFKRELNFSKGQELFVYL